jgi:hypothetical protein
MADDHATITIHHVFGDTANSPSGTNSHTHGLAELRGHHDLQITLPVRPEVAAAVFNRLVHLILNCGMRFRPGDRCPNVANAHMDVGFIASRESGRVVLRVILPDREGNIDPALMDPIYRAAQFG